jgi:hypothetical protein
MTRIILGGKRTPGELRPFGPALIAGVVRGLPPGAAGALAVFFGIFVTLERAELGLTSTGYHHLLALLLPTGAALGATVSAGDAVSRRTANPLPPRLLAAVAAPLAMVLAGLSVETVWTGRTGWETTLTQAATLDLALGSAALTAVLAFAQMMVGPPKPGGGWPHALHRASGLGVSAAVVVGMISDNLIRYMSAWSAFAIALLATLVYVAVHRACRPLYRGVRAWLEPES